MADGRWRMADGRWQIGHLILQYGGYSVLLPVLPRDVSSVGLEHRLDRAGVVGSNPSHPTNSSKAVRFNPVTAFFVGKHFLFVYFIPKAEL